MNSNNKNNQNNNNNTKEIIEANTNCDLPIPNDGCPLQDIASTLVDRLIAQAFVNMYVCVCAWEIEIEIYIRVMVSIYLFYN